MELGRSLKADRASFPHESLKGSRTRSDVPAGSHVHIHSLEHTALSRRYGEVSFTCVESSPVSSLLSWVLVWWQTEEIATLNGTQGWPLWSGLQSAAFRTHHCSQPLGSLDEVSLPFKKKKCTCPSFLPPLPPFPLLSQSDVSTAPFCQVASFYHLQGVLHCIKLSGNLVTLCNTHRQRAQTSPRWSMISAAAQRKRGTLMN